LFQTRLLAAMQSLDEAIVKFISKMFEWWRYES